MIVPTFSSIPNVTAVLVVFVTCMMQRCSAIQRMRQRLFHSVSPRTYSTLLDTPIVLSGLKQIIDRYDLILFDQFGVLHDGETQIPGALEVLEYLSKQKKTAGILSNTSNRKQLVVDKLTKLGFPAFLYDGGITCSGECAYEWIVDKHQAEKRQDKIRCCWFTWNSSRDGSNFVTDLDDILVLSTVENAELMLFHGTECVITAAAAIDPISLSFCQDGNLDDPKLQQMLTFAVYKKLPALCANLDFTAMTPNGLRYMPGNLEKEYIRLGGSCVGFGKPHVDFFQRALVAAETSHRKKFGSSIPATKKLRALHIGDSIHHDILGAHNINIDSILITEYGVHRDELQDTRKTPTEKSVDSPWDSPPEKSLVQKVCDLCDAEGVPRPSYISRQCTL